MKYKPFPEDVMEALELAARSEIMAAALYEKIGNSTSNPAVKETAAELTRQERGHLKVIEALYSKKFNKRLNIDENFPMEVSLPQDEKVLIREALKKEEDAYRFYLSLYNSARDQEVRETLAWLADAEKGHKAILERML